MKAHYDSRHLIGPPAPFVPTTDSWMVDASCAGLPPEVADVFFFNQTTPNAAKEMCNACPVQDECRTAGNDEEYGMWGGASVRERHRARKAS